MAVKKKMEVFCEFFAFFSIRRAWMCLSSWLVVGLWVPKMAFGRLGRSYFGIFKSKFHTRNSLSGIELCSNA
ncbi:MAG: hypothetical protein ACYSWP_00235 [Planctomycetota bacterium]|jgi:hypothetical protein